MLEAIQLFLDGGRALPDPRIGALIRKECSNLMTRAESIKSRMFTGTVSGRAAGTQIPGFGPQHTGTFPTPMGTEGLQPQPQQDHTETIELPSVPTDVPGGAVNAALAADPAGAGERAWAAAGGTGPPPPSFSRAAMERA